jgi:hypothetical protein
MLNRLKYCKLVKTLLLNKKSISYSSLIFLNPLIFTKSLMTRNYPVKVLGNERLTGEDNAIGENSVRNSVL